eukprot:jgi/Chlat1/3551/Chrsp234S03552
MASGAAAALVASTLLLVLLGVCCSGAAAAAGGKVAGFPHGLADPPLARATPSPSPAHPLRLHASGARGQPQAGPNPPQASRSHMALPEAGPTDATIASIATSVGGVHHVLIDAIAKPGQAAALVQQLQPLRVVASSVSVAGDFVSFLLPLDQVAELNILQALSFAMRSAATAQAGSVADQGDTAQRSAALRASVAGLTGAGVKVGVLSDSYNASGGAAQDVATGDLPSSGVTVLKDNSGGLDEGRAMLQIVHDVAPGAQLYFYSSFFGIADFANGIIALANAGCNIIIDDTFNFLEPYFQDGIVAQAVDQVKTQKGVSYFAAAGNYATQAWETTTWTEDANHLYLFDAANGYNVQEFVVPAGTATTIFLQWDQPYTNSANNLDLLVYTYDPSTDSLVFYDGDTADNTGGAPIAAVHLDNSDGYYYYFDFYVYLAIYHASGPAPSRVKYVYTPGPQPGGPTQFTTYSPTSFGHSQAAGCFSTAAAYSLGGTPTLFTPTGTRLATPIVRQKPDSTAPDGADTTFFFNGQDRNGNGLPDFSGTSAAAPHAGGLAALLLQANPTLTPDKMYAILRLTADDMDNPLTDGFDYGFDYSTGYGLLNAMNAWVAAACRTACGKITVTWPFYLDAGCGAGGYRLKCSGGVLSYTNPSGTFTVQPPLRTDYLLLRSVTPLLAAYGCPSAGSTQKSFSQVNTPFTISGLNVVIGYGTNVTASFTSYRANGTTIRSANCKTSPTGVPSYCNGTQCCTLPLTTPAQRIAFLEVGSCGGADILYPAAVVTTPVDAANAKNNYFLRLDFTAYARPKSTQACDANWWSATTHTCRWPYNLQPTTKLRDAFASTTANKAIVDSRYANTTTMQQALTSTASGNATYNNLAAQAAPALLNAYQIRYPLYVSEVQTQFLNALKSTGDPVGQTTSFSRLNLNKWCPLTNC